MGNYWGAIIITAGALLIIGNIDNIIRLVIAKRMADVHPVITLLGVLFGLQLFGIPGVVFGPLLISYFFMLFKIYKYEYSRDEFDFRIVLPTDRQPLEDEEEKPRIIT